MPREEQQARMRSMRSWTRTHNIYRWAGKMLTDAARVRARERVARRIEQLQQRQLRVAR
jgi:trehalose 6-phosphate synthase